MKSYEIQSMTGENKAWFTEAAAYRMQTGSFILARLFFKTGCIKDSLLSRRLVQHSGNLRVRERSLRLCSVNSFQMLRVN